MVTRSTSNFTEAWIVALLHQDKITATSMCVFGYLGLRASRKVFTNKIIPVTIDKTYYISPELYRLLEAHYPGMINLNTWT